MAWIPRGAKGVGVEITDDRWKLDRVQTERGITNVKVRRLHPVDGQLSIPDGSRPDGAWITGTGVGSAVMGHRPLARVRKDGTFTLYVAADHAYSLSAVGNKWASDGWTGVILAKDDATPKKLNFVAYPAVPLSILVTRGPKHESLEGAWVMV